MPPLEKKLIIVALDASPDETFLVTCLEKNYNILQASSSQECLELMRIKSAVVAAAVVNMEWARKDDYLLLRNVLAEVPLRSIPVVLVMNRQPVETDMECLSYGAADILVPPYISQLVIHRLECCMHSKSAKTFYEIEKILGRLPSNIFMKDANCRYMFSTKIMGHLDTGGDPNWSIFGKTDLDIRKDKENALKAMEADMEIISSGKGTSYIIEENTAGKQEFLELIKEPVFDDDGKVTGIIAIVNDVTEAELLRRQLDKSAHTDELTGLGNHRAFDETVNEIPLSWEFPVAVISADCDGLKMVNDLYGHLVGDEYIRVAAAAFAGNLPEGARAFRTGGDEFIAFLPATNAEDAEKIVSDILKSNQLFHVNEQNVSVSYGTAILESPNDKVMDAVRIADKGMYDCKAARHKARPDYYLNLSKD